MIRRKPLDAAMTSVQAAMTTPHLSRLIEQAVSNEHPAPAGTVCLPASTKRFIAAWRDAIYYECRGKKSTYQDALDAVNRGVYPHG